MRDAVSSADGRYVAVTTSLHPDSRDASDNLDAYVVDMQTGEFTWASPRASNLHYHESYPLSVSDDGSQVLFRSSGDQYVANDRNGKSDLFVWQKATDSIAAVTTSAFQAFSSHYDSSNPRVSADGRFVVFSSKADNLAPGSKWNQEKLLFKDSQTGEIKLLTVDPTGNWHGSLINNRAEVSDDGRFVLFTGNMKLVSEDTDALTDLYLVDSQSDEIKRLPGPIVEAVDANLQLTNDGEQVAFWSANSTLVPNDTNNAADLFLLQTASGAITRINTNAAGEQGNYNTLAAPFAFSLTPDGRYAVFSSTATNLVLGDTNRVADIFRKDLQTGAVQRVSVSTTQANAKSYQPTISDDGRYVSFVSLASLTPADQNAVPDVYVRDMQSGQLTRVSTSAAGQSANAAAEVPQISGNGRYVTWRSAASNLVPGDTNNQVDIFRRDLQTGAIVRVNPNSAGYPADKPLPTPQVTDDGRVVFDSTSTQLTPDDPLPARDIFFATFDLPSAAPLLDNTFNPALPQIAEDSVNHAGALVQAFVDQEVSDTDTGALNGIAVTGLGNTSQGTWQYSLDAGSSWTEFGSVTPATARLLPAEARVRFVPRLHFNGQVRMFYRAWDQTQASSDGTFDLSQAASVGDGTAFSLASESATLTVVPINDAPLLKTPLQPQFAPIDEGEIDSAGALVRDLIAGTVLEADANPLMGIAVIGAVSGYGRWEYALNGSNWQSLTGVSNSTARLLPADDTTRVRFVPTNLNYSGAVRLNYRLWDQTQGTSGGEFNLVGTGKLGGRTAFSFNVEVTTQVIQPVNDAPMLTNLGGPSGYSLGSAAILLSPAAIVQDVDSPLFTDGVLRVRISEGASAGNVLGIGGAFVIEGQRVLLSGTHVGTLNTNAGQGTADLVVTFTTNTTRGIVQQLVRAITFRASDSAGTRTLHFSLTDNAGASTGELSKSVMVS